jgi:hypothetical protein
MYGTEVKKKINSCLHVKLVGPKYAARIAEPKEGTHSFLEKKKITLGVEEIGI